MTKRKSNRQPFVRFLFLIYGIVMLWLYDLEAHLTTEQQAALDALIAEVTA